MDWRFCHGFTCSAILLILAVSISAAPEAADARPQGQTGLQPAAAEPTDAIIFAQTRAKTARDVERERAKKLEDQKRKTRRKRRSRRRTAVKSPAINAPPPIKKPANVDTSGGPGVSLSAALTAGGAQLTSGVVWTVEPLSGETPPTVTDESLPTLLVPAGRYRITAKLKGFLQSVEVDIPAQGIARLDLAFNAARLKVNVLPAKGAMPLETARIRIVKIDVDGLPPLVDTNVAVFDDLLPAGIYRVEAALGLARVSEDIGLTAGANRTVVLNLSVGYVRLRARPAPGREPLPNVVYEVLPADGLDAVPKPLASKSGAQAVFVLPAGTYRVVARYGEASSRQVIDIKSNTFSDIVLDLDAGQVVVTYADVASEPGASAAFRLIRHDGDDGPSLILSRTGTRLDIGLPVGSYTVEVELEDGRRADKPFLVEPGTRTEVSVVLPALPSAQLTLSAGMIGGGRLPDGDRDLDIAFKIRKAGLQNEVASGTLSQDATASLPAGAYEISAVHTPTGAATAASVIVDAGAASALKLEFPLGTVTLALAENSSDPAAEWVLTGIDGKEVARHVGPNADISLNPGEYIVTLTSNGTANTAALSVTEGKMTTIILPEN